MQKNSVEEESKHSSSSSIRKRDNNVSLIFFISQGKQDSLSPAVKGNVRYIEDLKRKYLKDGLLGKYLI